MNNFYFNTKIIRHQKNQFRNNYKTPITKNYVEN